MEIVLRIGKDTARNIGYKKGDRIRVFKSRTGIALYVTTGKNTQAPKDCDEYIEVVVPSDIIHTKFCTIKEYRKKAIVISLCNCFL